MILIHDIRLPLSAGEPQAYEKALRLARIPRGKVSHLGIARLSVDARHGHGVHQLGLAVAGIHRELCHAQMLHLSARDAGGVQGFFKCLRLSGRERQTDVANQNHVIVCSFLFQLLSMRHCST